jgi:hypothetical protein
MGMKRMRTKQRHSQKKTIAEMSISWWMTTSAYRSCMINDTKLCFIGLSRSFSCLIPCLRNMLAHFAYQVLFSVLRRNNPSWFNDERARYWRLPQKTITDQAEVQDDNDAERYRDQPTERATHRLAESEAENEQVI